MMITKKKKGFTLVELIVTIAIAGIIFAALMPIFPFTARLTSSANDITQAQSLAQMKMQAIESIIRYSKTLDIAPQKPDTLSSGLTYLYLDGGKIFTKVAGGEAEPITSDSGFEDYSYAVSFSPVNAKVIKTTVSVFKNSLKLYDFSSQIHAANLIDTSITGVSGGACLSYVMPDVSVSSIVVTSPSGMINIAGQTMQMKADVYPLNAKNRGVAWSVDKPDHAGITQEGLLTPLKTGTVTVKATALDGSGVSGTKMILISNQNVTITAITLTTDTGGTALPRGGHQMFIIPNIAPADATNQSLIWKVDDTALGTVDQNGVLTSGYPKPGKNSVIVTATTKDGSNLTATIEITIT